MNCVHTYMCTGFPSCRCIQSYMHIFCVHTNQHHNMHIPLQQNQSHNTCQKVLYILKRALHIRKRALHIRKRALQSHNTCQKVLYILKRALYIPAKEPYISLQKSPVYLQQSHIHPQQNQSDWGCLRLVGSLKYHVSFEKEPSKRDDIWRKRPIILSILLTVATPQHVSTTRNALSLLRVKRALYIRKSALCIRKRALCICKRAICICNRAMYTPATEPYTSATESFS